MGSLVKSINLKHKLLFCDSIAAFIYVQQENRLSGRRSSSGSRTFSSRTRLLSRHA